MQIGKPVVGVSQAVLREIEFTITSIRVIKPCKFGDVLMKYV